MAVPTFTQLMLPVLGALSDGKERTSAQVREVVAGSLKMLPADLAEPLPSSAQPKFTNRVHWALFYMVKGLLIERVRRGVHRITPRGQQVLKESPALSVEYLRRFPEFVAWYTRDSADSQEDAGEKAPLPLGEAPPNEQLGAAYLALRGHIEDEILTRIMDRSPEFFERLVLRLLGAMGYGDTHGAHEHRGRSGDGGIDGVIYEDKLGLDAIYIQAKRYDRDRTVPSHDVRDFIGALEVAKSKRGVFITTGAEFSKDSIDIVAHIEKRVVLINGRRLAALMFEHDVGVREKHRYIVKEIDEDTFLDETSE